MMSIDMSNPRTRDVLQLAATLPELKGRRRKPIDNCYLFGFTHYKQKKNGFKPNMVPILNSANKSFREATEMEAIAHTLMW